MAQDVTGRVHDANTGEGLTRVQIQLLGTPQATITDEEGRFAIQAVPPGKYTLHVSTVGYRTLRQNFEHEEQGSQHFEVALNPLTLRHNETVSVTAGPFPQESPTAVDLAGIELKNLASVLSDDPLRAVQALPGVTSNDDFRSQIALRGAGFERIGLYLDGVLLHSPFHALQGETASASMTLFNGDMLDSLELHAGAPPVNFADRTAGALDVKSRDGDRRSFGMHGTASASNASFLAEGPLGKTSPGRAARGSWLAAVRKSYLQYIVERTTDEPHLAFGFWDVQGRLSYDVSSRHNLSLNVVNGSSGLNRDGIGNRVGLNAYVFSVYRATYATLGSRWAPSASTLINNRLGFQRERYNNQNRERSPISRGGYGEWIWNADVTQVWLGAHPLEFGLSLRRPRDDGFFNRYVVNPTAVRRLDEYRGAGLRSGGYVKQSWMLASGRIQFTGAGRWDRHDVNGITIVSPHAAAVFQLHRTSRLSLAWGQYAQYPEINQFFSIAGHKRLLPMRATHAQASFEQRLDDMTRVRLEFYNRQDRDLLARPLAEPRILNGRIINPPLIARIVNSQRGYARGAQIFLQRRSANSFTGWIAYSYGMSRVSDGILNLNFPADWDQRHGVNVYGSYRLRPTVNLSVRHIYGSGLPVPGFFRGTKDNFFLADMRNNLRLDSYHRTDFRMNKAYVYDRWQITLFAEVINLINRKNLRFEELSSYNTRTGSTRLHFNTLLPIIPSAGLMVEF